LNVLKQKLKDPEFGPLHDLIVAIAKVENGFTVEAVQLVFID
jgi:hypothetical protein